MQTLFAAALVTLTASVIGETDPAYYDPVEYRSYNTHHYSDSYMPYTAFQVKREKTIMLDLPGLLYTSKTHRLRPSGRREVFGS